MSLRNKLRSQILKLVLSGKVQDIRRTFAERRRKLSGKAHVVAVYLELDDPYSYLLAIYLPELAAAYDIELRYYLAQSNSDEAFRPRTDMLAVYAEQDCVRLAVELGVPFLDRGKAPPVEYRRALIEALALEHSSGGFDEDLLEALTLYWRGDTEGVARRVAGIELTGKGDGLLQQNAQRLREAGHYNCAMLNYEGEWYWGIDRLHYLMSRLDDLGARRDDVSIARLASIQQTMKVSLPVARPSGARDLPPLELFMSFRSPYSYLCLPRAFELCDAFGLDLHVRPVLPMVMRGMQVPKQKIMYIALDTAREAQHLDMPYGKFADPVGRGVERCMAVFGYAQQEKREREFLLHVTEAIWAKGIDVATDEGMRMVTGRCGLFWPDVAAVMETDDWRAVAEDNRESMMDLGCWGVPTLRLGEQVVWGQDRVWLLARHIEEQCDTGEGILI